MEALGASHQGLSMEAPLGVCTLPVTDKVVFQFGRRRCVMLRVVRLVSTAALKAFFYSVVYLQYLFA